MPRFADPTTSPAVSKRQCINWMRDKTCVTFLFWLRNDKGLGVKLSAIFTASFPVPVSYSIVFAALHAMAMQTRSSDENSVRPSVKRVICDKMKERSVKIFISYERSFSLVFWEGEWLVEGGGDHFCIRPIRAMASVRVVPTYALFAV